MIRVDLPLPVDDQCLPGRSTPQPVPHMHAVLGVSYEASPPASHRRFLAGMGCFWGAERLFWQQPGVWRTAVGYAGGATPNPTYHEVCSGETGHTEVVEVIYDPSQTTLERLLTVFCEKHDPTQGMRQGNDIGTQYRSALYFDDDADVTHAQRILNNYGSRLRESGFGTITTEVRSGVPFYFAEEYHQQYLAKNPNGYCGIGGTGIRCAIDAMHEPASPPTTSRV